MKKDTVSHSKYKNAFNCKKCPQSNDENGCPLWWEQIWTDINTGEQRQVNGCGFVMLPNALITASKINAKSSNEISSMREEVAKSVGEATVRVLQLYGLKAEQLSLDKMEGHSESHERLVHKETDGGVPDRRSIHRRMDSK